MAKVFIDKITKFHELEIDLSKNVFKQLLESRENEIDAQRFFLRFISSQDLARYDFSNKESLSAFREDRGSLFGPVKGMAGCNLRPEMLEKNIRYGGIRISDPDKRIIGQFNVRNDHMIYSPIFPLFYEEYDLIKFANDEYFTTISFEDLVMNQINFAKKFFVHVGNSSSISDLAKYGTFIMEEITRAQMIDFLTNRENGEEVYTRSLNR